MNDTNNIHEHPFYTYKQLVDKLKSKGLIITNESQIISYFKAFNYQNVINGYNKEFLASPHYWNYLTNANSQMILDLFDFNRLLSVAITNDLHSIEMQLSSGISNGLMKRISILHPGRTCFLPLSEIEKYSLFKYQIDEGKDNEKINELFLELQDNYQKMKKEKDNINKSWEKWEEVPLYSLSLIWTFGVSIDLFCNLNNEIQSDILNSYFSAISKIDIKTFETLLYYFRDLRNKSSHNEVIYNFKFNLRKLIFKVRKFNSSSTTKISKIIQNDFQNLLWIQNVLNFDYKLISMLKIMCQIVNDKPLEEIIFELIGWLKQSIVNGVHEDIEGKQIYLPCKRAWKNICISLGYKDKNF